MLAVNLQIEGQQHASTVIRKNFHILAVVVFTPGLLRECCFIYLATGVVLAFFVALEVRIILSRLLNFMFQNTDGKISIKKLKLSLFSGFRVIPFNKTINIKI